MGTRATVAIAVGLMALTGCSVGSDQGEELPDGRASGTGYTLTLPDGWRTGPDSDSVQKKVADDSAKRGLDTDGIRFDGQWLESGDSDRKPTVNVTIEPVTGDTSLPDLAASSDGLLGNSARRALEPTRLGSTSARTTAYFRGDREGRLVVAKRGDYSYALTVQMQRGHSGALDALTRKAASSWRFTPLNGDDRAGLSRLGRTEGKGWRVRLPAGWRATSGTVLRRSGQQGDSLWRGHVDTSFATNVRVSVVPKPGDGLDGFAKAAEAQDRQQSGSSSDFQVLSLLRASAARLNGERAVALNIVSTTSGVPDSLRQREILAIHGSRAFRLVLSAPSRRYARDRAAFDRSLSTWRWR